MTLPVSNLICTTPTTHSCAIIHSSPSSSYLNVVLFKHLNTEHSKNLQPILVNYSNIVYTYK